jgi:hypothetical protein
MYRDDSLGKPLMTTQRPRLGQIMIKKSIGITGGVCLLALVGACIATAHRQAVQDDFTDKLTVGTV